MNFEVALPSGIRLLVKLMKLVPFKPVVFEVAFEPGDRSIYQHVFIEHGPCAQIFTVPVVRTAVGTGNGK